MSHTSFSRRPGAVLVWGRLTDRLTSLSLGAVAVDVALALFMGAMLVAMLAFPGEETVPYHLLFVSLALVYGFRVWPITPTLVVTGVVTLATGVVMYDHYVRGHIDSQELAEIPLMGMLFLAMVWHARRRAAALAQLAIMADERGAMLEREHELFRDASHAIRTPVTIARGHVELVGTAVDDPLVREDTEVILGQLDRITALSGGLLALARLDSDESVRPQPVDVADFLRTRGKHWAVSADREWRFDCAPVGWVELDPEWLEMALDAVIENAVHFTEPGDGIAVSCSLRDEACLVTVADEGPGFAPEDLPRVFERFWHRRPPNGPSGSGLGLSMARAVAVAHGGTVAASNRPAGGAVVTLTLPRRSPVHVPVPRQAQVYDER